MVKTQVQIPDHLYKEAKRISDEYEMSFAEVVRRGIEKIAVAYPPRKSSEDVRWAPPAPRALGFRGLSDEALKEAAQTTALEEGLMNRRGKRR
jgi:hypothetical protein